MNNENQIDIFSAEVVKTEVPSDLGEVTNITQADAPDLSRKERRKLAGVQNILIDILNSFYTKMRTAQLTEEELGKLFTAHDTKWKKVCTNKKLNKDSYLLFAQEVSATWENLKKKAKKKADQAKSKQIEK